MSKKEFTSFDASAVVHELKDALVNSRVNNVYQLDAKTLLLKLHKTDKPPLRLVMEASRRLHLTAYALETPLAPPAFCMALRKHLRSAWLSGVEQYEFERIITFYFRTKTGLLRLILELFGEGNIILTSEKGEILQALIFKHMRDRNILRNEVFQFPPSSGKNPFKVTREELEKAVKDFGEVEVVRAIARFLSVGGVYAEEVLLRANVEKTKHCNALTNPEVNAIFDGLQSLLSTISSFKMEPRIVLAEDGSFLDVVPFRLKRYDVFKSQPYSSFNEALDEFYVKVTAAEKAVASIGVDELQREAERLKRVMAEQEQALREAESKGERDKCIGDVIYAHSSELQALLDRFSPAKREGKDWNAVIAEVLTAKRSGRMPEAFVESFDARNLAVNVCIDNLRFSVNLRRTLFENAAEFYERGKKAKQKSAGALTALEESRRRLAEIEQSMREAEALKRAKPLEAMKELVKRKVKGKEWYEKFRWFISSDSFLIVAGKDAVSNEVLIKKYAAPDDVVFHADITGAPFVVVKIEGKEPSEQALREAGEFAAAFSRGWREGFGSADVYWVKPSQLSKSGPSGEYVPHGAFAVSGKRNWMRNVPLKLAIGVVENGEVKFVGGPFEAVKAKTKTYVTIGPGDVMGKELLKQVLRALALKLPKEQREKVGKASIERIREFVPYAKGRLVETVS
ncbi:MAG TPA: ribosome rescue protein RqcH [Candidatus Bathyarchaeia archaeon]|nr:ribosome rescue protein RqcH [Candidatus Bathyarchaeia archaeon]